MGQRGGVVTSLAAKPGSKVVVSFESSVLLLSCFWVLDLLLLACFDNDLELNLAMVNICFCDCIFIYR